MGRGRGVARREGGAQQAGPHPLTRAHAHPPNAHNPRDGLADPHPSRAPRARRRTARSVPGSREEVGDHAHARTRAAARRGRRSPTPRGDPDVRAASERRTAVPGPGDSRARAAAAPAHASGRGPGPGRGPAPSPAGGRGRRGGARHSTAKGKATEAGRRARPARDGGPGPGPRAPGRAPPPGPGGRASDRPGGGRPSHTSHEHLPGRDHRAALGRTHAPNGATPRGERTGLPPPAHDADDARDHTPRGRAAAGPGSEAHPVGGGRAPTRCGRAGRDKTRRRARQAAKRGGGAPGDASGAVDRHQDTRGGLTASSLRARRRPRVAPGAADQAFSDPCGSPTATPSRTRPEPPEPASPHTHRKADPNPPGAHRAATDLAPKARAVGVRGHRANQRGRRRRRPQKAEPGSGPDGAANSIKAGEPLGEERIGRRRTGKRSTRQARSQGATETRARGTRRGPTRASNPQARPGHQENTATGSHRHRHEGGPAAPRLGRRTALGQPTEQPPHEPRVPPPAAPKQPQPQAQHQGPHVARLSSVPDPVPLRETGAPPRGDGSLPKDQAAPHPAPRERGHRQRSRLGTGAGGEPAHSGERRRAPDGVPRAPAARSSLPIR